MPPPLNSTFLDEDLHKRKALSNCFGGPSLAGKLYTLIITRALLERQ